jgi:CBS domain-containing protein
VTEKRSSLQHWESHNTNQFPFSLNSDSVKKSFKVKLTLKGGIAFMSQKLQELMSKNVVSVSPDQSLQQAASLMSQFNVGSLPVVQNGQIQGIITDRDITLRSTAQGLDGNTPVSQCMSAGNLISGNPNMDIHEAAALMSQSQIRRLPVVDNNQLVGMVALGDLATQNIYQNEAGQALSSISTPSNPQNLQ